MRKRIFAIVALAVCFSAFFACQQQAEQYQGGTIKAKQIEAQLNMDAIGIAQMGFKTIQSRYGNTFAEIGFSLTGEEQQRYSYFLGDDVLKGARGPAKLPEGMGPATVTESGYTVYAIANLDDDPTLDVWVTDQSRVVRHTSDDRLGGD
jgi:hypothetical protein